MKIPKISSPAVLSDRVSNCIGDVVAMPNVRKAIAYLAPNFVVKATAQRRQDGRDSRMTLLVTVGAPNFVERRFIKVCQKAGIVFPLRQIQWKFWPGSREKKVR